ncbi:MAG: hypothetical protein H7Z37_08645 [Pyrinomonadaceae bacterium]|nr:hypothetical protein [Pyrinomonadaceae bacterium]
MIQQIEFLIQDLPDADFARRFFTQLTDKNPVEANKLLRQQNQGLLADVLALATFSPFLATTLLQHPEYISWFGRNRNEANNRGRDELLESLARFSATNSTLEPQILLSRFRRRELLRLYLRDIRKQETIAEITEELSNLADACLENALQIARQELDNRFGIPLEIDDNGRAKRAKFSIVALGKLGSRELNYASDIDLMFIYSNDGATSGTGRKGATSNREYFGKLAEQIAKIAGEQTNEGAAYRVDLRLRPHGRVGALAVSLKEAVNYYKKTAQSWERQVLIRSRSSAGDAEVFKDFYAKIETNIYQIDETVENALQNVRLSKQKINLEHGAEKGFNVKLGKGGIREIEFIAQALQLAFGGRDKWLREPHTLISLKRLTDRNLLTENELTELSDAYSFLRTLEHRLQMENGFQTHAVPDETHKRELIAKRMKCNDLTSFDEKLKLHSNNVNRVFERVFNRDALAQTKRKTSFSSIRKTKTLTETSPEAFDKATQTQSNQLLTRIAESLESSEISFNLSDEKLNVLTNLSEISPYFGEMLAANPRLIEFLPNVETAFSAKNYSANLRQVVENQSVLRDEFAAMRSEWAKHFLEIGTFDALEKISLRESKKAQTELAESSVETALIVAKKELTRRFGEFGGESKNDFTLSVLGLGKFGSRGMDYGSDLDLILIYDDEKPSPVANLTHAEFYSRATEIFIAALSSLTREGHLYRVDLRLRPDGKNGATCLSKSSFFNYLRERAQIWELLAYVKLRAAGNLDFSQNIETGARKIVHERAGRFESNELNVETKRVRDLLESENALKSRRSEINIKHGAGGMLDVYFAVRYLQLRDNLPDDEANRSTDSTLKILRENGSLSEENFTAFSEGYDFLQTLDHASRLILGRSKPLPGASQSVLSDLARRIKLNDANELLIKIAVQTANIRTAYEKVMS